MYTNLNLTRVSDESERSDGACLVHSHVDNVIGSVYNEVRVAKAYQGTITGGGFLSEWHIDSIPITVYHVTAASAIVTREEDVCFPARLSRLNS